MPTSRVEIGGNLDANDLSAAQRYPQLFGSTFTFPLPAGENWQDARTYNFSTSIKAYDSSGSRTSSPTTSPR